jgi:hypothetical protein
MMGYRSARRKFQPGERVVFDEGYRLAHLPLVNAGHPAVISEVDGREYRNGTYEKTRYALVMPISADAFLESDQVQALELAMKSSGFAPKIAWEMCELRRSRLHASIGVVPTKLYLVGYYHMRNELDPLEARELAELIDQWRDRIVVRTTIPFLELYATNDDLALSARVHAKISARERLA